MCQAQSSKCVLTYLIRIPIKADEQLPKAIPQTADVLVDFQNSKSVKSTSLCNPDAPPNDVRAGKGPHLENNIPNPLAAY